MAGSQEQLRGLFNLDGDRFPICLALAGATRPGRFATSAGSGHALEELVRIEHMRPAGADGGTPPVVAPKPVAVIRENEFETAATPAVQKLQG